MNALRCKKIAVIGISGSGKTTAAKQLSAKIGLPVFHIDPLLWIGNWESVPHDEYIANHMQLLKNNRWIIEGYIDEEMSDRLHEADLVIYLDYSVIRCVGRVIYRWWKYRNKNRPELPKEAHEKFDLSFFMRVLIGFERKDIQQALSASKPSLLVTIHSPKELKQFLRTAIY